MREPAQARGRGSAPRPAPRAGDGLAHLVPPALPRDLPAHLQRARSTSFTSGHASWPQVVEVMEQIKKSKRTHGRR